MGATNSHAKVNAAISQHVDDVHREVNVTIQRCADNIQQQCIDIAFEYYDKLVTLHNSEPSNSSRTINVQRTDKLKGLNGLWVILQKVRNVALMGITNVVEYKTEIIANKWVGASRHAILKLEDTTELEIDYCVAYIYAVLISALRVTASGVANEVEKIIGNPIGAANEVGSTHDIISSDGVRTKIDFYKKKTNYLITDILDKNAGKYRQIVDIQHLFIICLGELKIIEMFKNYKLYDKVPLHAKTFPAFMSYIATVNGTPNYGSNLNEFMRLYSLMVLALCGVVKDNTLRCEANVVIPQHVNNAHQNMNTKIPPRGDEKRQKANVTIPQHSNKKSDVVAKNQCNDDVKQKCVMIALKYYSQLFQYLYIDSHVHPFYEHLIPEYMAELYDILQSVRNVKSGGIINVSEYKTDIIKHNWERVNVSVKQTWINDKGSAFYYCIAYIYAVLNTQNKTGQFIVQIKRLRIDAYNVDLGDLAVEMEDSRIDAHPVDHGDLPVVTLMKRNKNMVDRLFLKTDSIKFMRLYSLMMLALCGVVINNADRCKPKPTPNPTPQSGGSIVPYANIYVMYKNAQFYGN